MDVLHAFIYEVQVDFMAGVKRCARETVNSLGTGMHWRESQEKTYFLRIHRNLRLILYSYRLNDRRRLSGFQKKVNPKKVGFRSR